MDKQLLDILACPRCRGTLELKEENTKQVGLLCTPCALLFPIRDDIPIMLLDEAQDISKQEG